MSSNAIALRERRQPLRVGRVDDVRLAVDDFVHAVGRGRRLLNALNSFEQPPRGIGHAGQHREEHAHHAVRQRRIADLDAQHVRVLAEHQIAAHQARDQHHRQCPAISVSGADQRIVRGDPHLPAEIAPSTIRRTCCCSVDFHREGLDQLDAAQRFASAVS